MKAYLVEIGVLLSKNNEAFDSYSSVYDKKYAYYDEDQFYLSTKEEAIKQVQEYVSKGVEHTYGIISKTELDDDIDFTSDDIPVSDEKYLIDDIIYSIAKFNNQIIENFIQK